MPTIPYKNSKGERLQGATGIMKNVGWGTTPLMIWSNKQGLEGRTLQESYNTATAPGTIVHAMIESDLKGLDWRKIIGPLEYTPSDVSNAENAFLNYLQWKTQFQFEPIHIEKNLVSEKWQYGGCPDIIGKVLGKWALIDWKSGKGAGKYPILFLQFAAYLQLIYENDLVPITSPIELHCLRTSKDEQIPSFAHFYWGQLPPEAWDSFECALKLARNEKRLKELL